MKSLLDVLSPFIIVIARDLVFIPLLLPPLW